MEENIIIEKPVEKNIETIENIESKSMCIPIQM